MRTKAARMKSHSILICLLFIVSGCSEVARDYMPDSMAGMSLLLPPDEDYSVWSDKGAYYMNSLGNIKCSDADWYSADAYRMADYVNRSNQKFDGKVPRFTREKAHEYLMSECQNSRKYGTLAYAGRWAYESWIGDTHPSK
jgi:hypothetical protein